MNTIRLLFFFFFVLLIIPSNAHARYKQGGAEFILDSKILAQILHENKEIGEKILYNYLKTQKENAHSDSKLRGHSFSREHYLFYLRNEETASYYLYGYREGHENSLKACEVFFGKIEGNFIELDSSKSQIPLKFLTDENLKNELKTLFCESTRDYMLNLFKFLNAENDSEK